MLCQTQKKISYTATVMIVDALIHNLPTVMKNMKITIHIVYIYITYYKHIDSNFFV